MQNSAQRAAEASANKERTASANAETLLAGQQSGGLAVWYIASILLVGLGVALGIFHRYHPGTFSALKVSAGAQVEIPAQMAWPDGARLALANRLASGQALAVSQTVLLVQEGRGVAQAVDGEHRQVLGQENRRFILVGGQTGGAVWGVTQWPVVLSGEPVAPHAATTLQVLTDWRSAPTEPWRRVNVRTALSRRQLQAVLGG